MDRPVRGLRRRTWLEPGDDVGVKYSSGDLHAAAGGIQAGTPDEACPHFLPAFHYLVLGSKDTALTQLNAVVQLQPEDKLSAAPVKALTTGADAGGEQPRTGPGG